MWLLLSVWLYSVINTNYVMTTHNMISWICGESIFCIQSTMSTSSFMHKMPQQKRKAYIWQSFFMNNVKYKCNIQNINAMYK